MERPSNISYECGKEDADLLAIASFRLALTCDKETLQEITDVAPDALEWQECNFGFVAEEGDCLIKSPEDLVDALRRAIKVFHADNDQQAMRSLIEHQAQLLYLLRRAFPYGQLKMDTRMAIDEAWEELLHAARWVDGTEV